VHIFGPKTSAATALRTDLFCLVPASYGSKNGSKFTRQATSSYTGWQYARHAVVSDLAKRTEILPGLRQVPWDLVVVDEAHRMSWSPPARKTARYALGELLRDSSNHILLLTATPHKGDPQNFTLFLQLLDPDAYADVMSALASCGRAAELAHVRVVP
jgi:superfamily II DNA or RNA helicase